MPESREASNYDEASMEQSMLFSDGLKVYIFIFFENFIISNETNGELMIHH